MGTTVIPILQMRLGQTEALAQGHTPSEQQSRDSRPESKPEVWVLDRSVPISQRCAGKRPLKKNPRLGVSASFHCVTTPPRPVLSHHGRRVARRWAVADRGRL